MDRWADDLPTFQLARMCFDTHMNFEYEGSVATTWYVKDGFGVVISTQSVGVCLRVEEKLFRANSEPELLAHANGALFC